MDEATLKFTNGRGAEVLVGGLNVQVHDQVQHMTIRYGVVMKHCYRHLSAEDRAAIMMMQAKHSIRAIATHLGRAPSTVSREIARHTVDPLKGNDASLAGYRARLTRHRPRQRPKAAS